jgi:hypothetical protein
MKPPRKTPRFTKDIILKGTAGLIKNVERISARSDWTAPIVEGWRSVHAALLNVETLLHAVPDTFSPPDRSNYGGAGRELVACYVRPVDKHAHKYVDLETSQPLFPDEGFRVRGVIERIAVIELDAGELRAPIGHFEVVPTKLRAGQLVLPKERFASQYVDDNGKSIFPAKGLKLTAIAGTIGVIETAEEKHHIPLAHLRPAEEAAAAS